MDWSISIFILSLKLICHLRASPLRYISSTFKIISSPLRLTIYLIHWQKWFTFKAFFKSYNIISYGCMCCCEESVVFILKLYLTLLILWYALLTISFTSLFIYLKCWLRFQMSLLFLFNYGNGCGCRISK